MNRNKIIALFLLFAGICITSCKNSKKTYQEQPNTEKYMDKILQELLNTEKDINKILQYSLEQENYLKVLEILKSTEGFDFSFQNQSLLSYCVTKNLTDIVLEILSNPTNLQLEEIKENPDLFERILYNLNIILEKAFLENGIDIAYKDRGDASFLDICL